MKYTPISFGISLSLLLLLGCSKPGTESDTAYDSTAIDSTAYGEDLDLATSDEVNEPSSEALTNVVDYYGSIDDSVEMALASFEPLEKVLTASRAAIYFKDSIEFARQTTELTDPKDSALFIPRMSKAHAAIKEYQAAMQNGIKLNDRCPRLTDIVRIPGESDKTSEVLPEERGPGLLSNTDFFFLGGAPFIDRDEETFKGPGGKPEVHYTSSVTENSNYFFNSIYHYTGGAVNVTFGPELNSYESGEQGVNGIGSLIHTFAKRIPVFFLTDEGPVQAQLISVRIKLVPQGMGCMSDAPLYTFASAENLEPREILGVFVPYGQMSLDNLQINRIQVGVWTADFNRDGISEIACVSGVFEGITSDMMDEVLWFVNIGGEWRILDWGAEPDCT